MYFQIFRIPFSLALHSILIHFVYAITSFRLLFISSKSFLVLLASSSIYNILHLNPLGRLLTDISYPACSADTLYLGQEASTSSKINMIYLSMLSHIFFPGFIQVKYVEDHVWSRQWSLRHHHNTICSDIPILIYVCSGILTFSLAVINVGQKSHVQEGVLFHKNSRGKGQFLSVSVCTRISLFVSTTTQRPPDPPVFK